MKSFELRKKTYLVCMLLAAGLLMIGCKEDAKTPAPEAKFSYTANNYEVTFTNKSTNATSYEWDFGDGKTVTEENPTHTYEAFGTYNVKLMVTGDGGEDATLKEVVVAKSSSIAIDGDFSDWADIPVLAEGDTAAGTLRMLKVDFDENYLYFYVQGTDNFQGYFDLYIDNNSPISGEPIWYWMAAPDYPDSLQGAEWVIEGDVADWKDAYLFSDDPVGGGWTWLDPPLDLGSGLIGASSGRVNITGGKAMEFTVVKALITGLGTKISIGIVDVETDDEYSIWNELGQLPVVDGVNSMAPYSME